MTAMQNATNEHSSAVELQAECDHELGYSATILAINTINVSTAMYYPDSHYDEKYDFCPLCGAKLTEDK